MIKNNKRWCLVLTTLISGSVAASDLPAIPLGVYYDVALDNPRLSEYTKVPDVLMGYDMPLGVDLTNLGATDQSNIAVEVDIYLGTVYQTTLSSLYFGPLTAGQTGSLDMGTYPVTALGVYKLIYTATLDGEVDNNPANNQVIVNNMVEVTNDTMSRDDGGPNTGILSVGGATAGYLGNLYEFSTEVTVSSVQFIHDNTSCDPALGCSLDDEILRVDVFEMNTTTGLPDVMVGSSEEYVVPVGPFTGTVVALDFVGGLNLPAGGYVFALAEPELGFAQLHTTENRFTPGTAWIDFPGSPSGGWTNNEGYGFSNTYYMRPKFEATDLIFKNGFE